jgi:hypothetical protein
MREANRLLLQEPHGVPSQKTALSIESVSGISEILLRFHDWYLSATLVIFENKAAYTGILACNC